ncbi:MAG: hypothetical protein ACXWEO_03595 [Methylobacter sp.]
MKNKAKHPLIRRLMMLFGVIVQLTLTSAANAAPLPSPPVVQVQTGGSSYSELSARWWQWALSIPANINPILDTSGVNCAQGQYDDVWFLAGDFGGAVKRNCTIPLGKPIFFPVINSVAYKPLGSETLLSLRKLLNDSMALVTKLEVTIDGGKTMALSDLANFRVRSPSFTVIVPSNGLLPQGQTKVPGNTDSLVSDGYWLLLSPLSGGAHTIIMHAENSNGYVADVEYDLTVER